MRDIGSWPRRPGKWFRSWQGNLILILVVMLLATISIQRTAAHGIGTPQLVNVPVGPYTIWAYSDPDPLRVGEMHITVGVAEQKTLTMLDNVTIQVMIQPLDGLSPVLTVNAENIDSMNRLLYTAVLTPPVAGQWNTTINLAGASGEGSVDFTTVILPRQFISWEGILRLSVGLSVAGWVVWTWRRWQPPTQRRSAASVTPPCGGDAAGAVTNTLTAPKGQDQ